VSPWPLGERQSVGILETTSEKDLEAVLLEFHKLGWRIEDPPDYTVKCPCPKQHKRWVHLTPRNSELDSTGGACSVLTAFGRGVAQVLAPSNGRSVDLRFVTSLTRTAPNS
jgi:hypothetical protein